MKRVVYAAAIVIAAAGCQQPIQVDETPPDAAAPGLGGSSASMGAGLTAPELNIGDVEQALYFEGNLAAESKTIDIETEEIRDRRDRLLMTTITVPRPAPDHLYLQYVLRANRIFEERPAAAHARVVVEAGGEPAEVGQIGGVVASERKDIYAERQFDLMAAIPDPAPDSVLVRMEVTGYLLPEGTAPDSIDTATITVEDPEDQSGAVPWSAIRIEFTGEAAPEPTPESEPIEEAAPETAAPSEAPVEAPGTVDEEPAAEAPAEPAPAAEDAPAESASDGASAGEGA